MPCFLFAIPYSLWAIPFSLLVYVYICVYVSSVTLQHLEEGVLIQARPPCSLCARFSKMFQRNCRATTGEFAGQDNAL